MMLRVSAMTTETDVDLQGVNGDAASAAKGIEHGAELMNFAESLAQRNEQELARTRLACLLYTSPSPRDRTRSRMPSSA